MLGDCVILVYNILSDMLERSLLFVLFLVHCCVSWLLVECCDPGRRNVHCVVSNLKQIHNNMVVLRRCKQNGDPLLKTLLYSITRDQKLCRIPLIH